VKTVQSLMRHANSNITMNIYTHAVSGKKKRHRSQRVSLNAYFLVYRADFPKAG
jgi:integrase